HLDEMDEQPAKPVDESRLQRSRERVESLAAERRRDVQRRVQIARELLRTERALLSHDALADLDLRLTQVLAEDNVMAARSLAERLVADIEEQRVHRWSLAEGEAALVDHVVDYCTQQLHFDPDDVRRLYVAAKTKPFVILA